MESQPPKTGSESAANPAALLVPADYEQITQSLRYCVIVHDATTKNILWANQATCDMLGFTVEELKPLKAPDMSSPDHQYRRSVGVRWLEDAAATGFSRTEWMYRSKAGVDILTEALAIRVELASGAAIMVQFRNIEEEEAIKTDLQRAEGRLQAFLKHMAEGIVVLADDGRISYASDSAAAHLGRPVKELVGTRFSRYCTGASQAVLAGALRVDPTADASRSIRLRIDRPDGDVRWYATSCQRIAVKQDLTGTLLLFHDVTEHVQSEVLHKRDLEHLNYLGRNNAMGDMAMAIVHELGQPLAAATNFMDGIARRIDTPDPNSTQLIYGLGKARAQLLRASQIVKSLREFVMNLEQSEQVVDLNEIVSDCLYFIGLRATEKRTRVTTVLHPEPLWIRCEKVLTGQVVLNLCHNAIDEMAEWPEGDREITLTTSKTSDSGMFRVVDQGKGLSHIPDGRVFDGAFTSKATGSGIGLALSHRIITRQHGTIHAEENHPHGAAFTFELPLTDPNSDDGFL